MSSRTEIHVGDAGAAIVTVDETGVVHAVGLDWHALAELARERGRRVERGEAQAELEMMYGAETRRRKEA